MMMLLFSSLASDVAQLSTHAQTRLLFAGIAAVLVVATVIAETLRWRARHAPSTVLANLVSRIRAWWVMVIVFGVAVCGYLVGLVLFFASCSTSGSGEGDIRPRTTTGG